MIWLSLDFSSKTAKTIVKKNVINYKRRVRAIIIWVMTNKKQNSLVEQGKPTKSL
jgi:hypothetical protein